MAFEAQGVMCNVRTLEFRSVVHHSPAFQLKHWEGKMTSLPSE